MSPRCVIPYSVIIFQKTIFAANGPKCARKPIACHGRVFTEKEPTHRATPKLAISRYAWNKPMYPKGSSLKNLQDTNPCKCSNPAEYG